MNDNEPLREAEKLVMLSEKAVRERAMEIVALPAERRALGYQLLVNAYWEGFFKMPGTSEADFRKWLETVLTEIRQLVHVIDASGGADGGNA